MTNKNEEEPLLEEYKKYVRFDFFVIYGLSVLYFIFRGFTFLLVHDFQKRFVEPRKERLSVIKSTLSIESRKKAYLYFCVHYAALILIVPTVFTLFIFLQFGTPNFKYYFLVGFFLAMASTGFIASYYGIVEGQEMDSMIWGEDGYKKKNDPKERLKHPF
ncbi:hypothetical protein IEN85_09965 [Pelagicoccus sp. NFK12]|uniref:Uncharacterized protein n=1 Tax=Pelagicoccus enzymogenes TaxID=2773457 RepID=A0A927IHL2_9BACT|nr:hypothetical protein [Pelagicoccus enzymogenes]MBD5779818.1 hypothetical protein [Pelagicoccus enzymogenes]